MEENLVKIENFFRLDLKIKDLLCKCKPEELNTYNDGLRIKYGEKLLDVLEIIKDCLTINELLYLFHQYVTNNENYYQCLK